MKALILLLFTSISLFGQQYLIPQNQDYESRAGYFYSYNQGRKVVNWISYKLDGSDVKGKELSLRSFHKDSAESMCATPEDYDRYGYDMGRLKPRSAARNNNHEMREVHNMLNIAPMDVAFSKGAWRILDNMIAGWAVVFDSIYVVTGPIYERKHPEMIGESRVNVPDKFFKVILVRNGLDLAAIGFIVPNNSEANNLNQFAMPIDSVEAKTGYNFFPDLPEYLEVFTEEKVESEKWKDQSVSYKLKSSWTKELQCVAAEKSDERCTSKTKCVTQNCWKHGCDVKSN